MSDNPQTPSVGRIVVFKSKQSAGLGLNHNTLPAIITRVWSDTCINVVVFPDGYGPVQCLGVTSVRYDEAEPGDMHMSTAWSWPKRV